MIKDYRSWEPTFLPWRWESIVTLEVWVIEDLGNTEAAIYKGGRFERLWALFYLVKDDLVHLVEFDVVGPLVVGFRPHFADILGTATNLDLPNGCVLEIEKGKGILWWLFYVQLRGGTFYLLFVYQAVVDHVEREMRVLELDETSNEADTESVFQLLFDFLVVLGILG
jgi:hypothetical protein